MRHVAADGPSRNDFGTRVRPFDLATIEAGRHGTGWPGWHLGPEQAVNSNQRAQARVLLPLHRGLFTLVTHA
ncbi:MAG: hypothetical protein ABJB66_06835 [Gemmatimonadaceae bacterium]